VKLFTSYFTKLILFWFFSFFVLRVLFYLGNTFLLGDVPFSLILQSFYKALRLDLSMLSYFIALPMVFAFIFSFSKTRFVFRLVDILTCFFIVLYSTTAVGEMCLYREWKAKLSMQALEHFLHPSEVFKTASLGLTFVFFSLSIVFSWLLIRIYKRKVSILHHPQLHDLSFGKFKWKSSLFFFISIVFCALSVRGGWQEIPIQSSDAFFCTQPTVNDAAVNPLWNLVFNFVDYEDHFKENPYQDFDVAKANEIVAKLYKTEKDSTQYFLTTTRPNIAFIILEGWSANEIKSYGGDDFARFMDSLSNQGIRFTKLYPAAYVSDQGIPAVLSGYPSLSRISVINQSTKSAKLPCINQDLKKIGYQSGFAFGGDLNYGNIKSYIFNKQFDVVKEEPDFDKHLPRGNLGIQDADMANEYLQLLNAAKPPFVYAWFTLSTHMPYDYKGEKKKLTDQENDYVNSIEYADNALHHFFDEAKKQAWYQNTLFVIVSDHSHGSQKNLSEYDPEFHRIPLLFFGEVIKPEFRGKNIDKVYSQLDISSTLLYQLKLDSAAKAYGWSKNMFNPYMLPFAFFCNYGGAGFVTNQGYIGYQHKVKQLIVNSFGDKNPNADTLTTFAKAFQEAVYEDYRLK